MSTNSQDQEIDLGQIGAGIKKLLNSILNTIFDFIFFIKKKIIVIVILFVLGVFLGFYADRTPNYTQDITVIPNFGSNEYLYKKIDFLNSRIIEKDDQFFKSIGVVNYDKIGKIEIKAINGIFGFVNMRNNEQNFELIKLMAEDGNIDEIIKNDITSKNFYFHNITFKTEEQINQKEIVDPIVNYLQENTFYKKQQKIFQENLREKIQFNDSLIHQIDGLIIKLTSNSSSGSSISISEKNGVSELINKKDELIKESQNLKVNLHEYEDIIKVQNISLNNVNNQGTNNKMKLILPFLFVFIYLAFYGFILLYKKQLVRVNS
ncbi:hypothetical protein [Flavobacterium sp. N2820]|uniref:hypothetical protein n=1 Tax=Flavobacterium sp. N2820 TaxID=2986834 RepID=UPI002223F949|nr:hypothetical protein [Flavobacterium sp. N2820]